MIPWLLGALVGCGLPPVCEEMCAVATTRQGECLGERDWADVGYDDAADHAAWCETWAWEQQMLERDAGDRGRTEALCDERADAVPDLTCDEYDALAWTTER